MHALETFLDYTPLPASSMVSVGDVVHVGVVDPDDLGLWVEKRGGTVRVHPAGDGLEVHVLHTATPRAGGGTVRVQVSALVPVGAQAVACPEDPVDSLAPWRAAPLGDEHIEWDRAAERWRLVLDDEDDVLPASVPAVQVEPGVCPECGATKADRCRRCRVCRCEPHQRGCAVRCGEGWYHYQARDGEYVSLRCPAHGPRGGGRRG